MSQESLKSIGGVGEPARLFPVLSESSREGRTLSAMLSVIAHVPEFADAILRPLGRPIGKRATVEAYTEVTFEQSRFPTSRPDGVLVVRTGKTVWRALVEAKIGTAKLERDQIETYLAIARDVDADAVITISNDFVARPDQHPIEVNKRLLRKTELFHVSWFSFLTAINLIRAGDTNLDGDHKFVLRELERFLVHPSAGLQRFTKMPSTWKELLDRFRGGLSVSKKSDEARDVVSSWHSELRDLCLLMSRRTGSLVELKLTNRLRFNQDLRIAKDCETLASSGVLTASLEIPSTAGTLDIEADLTSRTLRVSVTLEAPKDRARQASRVNWLTRQLRHTSDERVLVQSYWPGRAPVIESDLAEAIEKPEFHSHPDRSLLPHSFATTMRFEDGRKFSGSTSFITALEELVIDFYEIVLANLKAWQAPPPKLRDAVEDQDLAEDSEQAK